MSVFNIELNLSPRLSMNCKMEHKKNTSSLGFKTILHLK